MYKGLLYFLLIFTSGMSSLDAAAIYKWVDANGKVHYSDTPSASNATETIDEQHLNSRASTYSQTQEKLLSTGNPSTYRKQQKIVMYTTSSCGYCAKARAYFAEKSIIYKEKNIETSKKYHSEFKALGGKGVPVILWGKNKMNGFSIAAFEKRYKESS
ncbi:glutaredoxin family protein [Colwellia sp. MSW7]|jgi:glutaredoxin|uniref:Glutaredoxin family protein n=1 Tax=Colwellia maritima TaxID=2912588 RepID=A0ABS9X3S6_9GAMM|nr:glutaredoxin family protein [Colwellia maritima]MCI2284887.1 glutaredoxin family protein [Colwellia maritima]